ncbi:MAG: septum formation inhibitor Maf [Actinobacteria bacterium]|nr:MAG: septum formation inhibitor Maf [Actinomycetota bacterium]
MKLVLGSSSPRRREILASLDLAFDVLAPDVDETRFPDEPAGTYVERIARSKAKAVSSPDVVVIAADTAVVLEGRVLGKPVHPEEARTMLRRLRGVSHEVLTGVAISARDEIHSVVESTEVEMEMMTDDEIASYVDGGEPMDKAGAYALQGEGGVFVKRVVGSPSNVVGLPVHVLPRLFGRVGLELSQFRSR